MTPSDFNVTIGFMGALALIILTFVFIIERHTETTRLRPVRPAAVIPKRPTAPGETLTEYEQHLVRMEKHAKTRNELLSVWLFIALGGLQAVTIGGLILLAPLINNPVLLLIVGGVLLFNVPVLFGLSRGR